MADHKKIVADTIYRATLGLDNLDFMDCEKVAAEVLKVLGHGERYPMFKRFWIQYEEPERGEPSMSPASSWEVAAILRDCGWTVEEPNYNREAVEVKTS